MASANMKTHKLGWIGIGRMGYAMAERLAKAGCDISVWNRTRAKAEPLAKSGAKAHPRCSSANHTLVAKSIFKNVELIKK